MIIGLRAEPAGVYLVLLSKHTTSDEPVLEDSTYIKFPKMQDESKNLAYLTTELSRITTNKKITGIAIRETENTSKNVSRARVRVEGVVLAFAGAAGIPARLVQTTSIAPALGSKSLTPVFAESEFRGINWSEMKNEQKEAIAAGMVLL